MSIEKFLEDIDRALCDYAGISSSEITTYISGARLTESKDDSFENPFNKEIIEVGNGPEDTAQYYNFFDMTKIPKDMMYKPLFVHLDMSLTGDKTGIAGVWIKGKKPPVEGSPPSKELFYQLAFSIAIKAPKGHQISFEKNRQFIYWLKEQGFIIKGVSSDSYQAADLGQTLTAKGYPYDTVSVDRVDTDKINKPYQYFRSTIYENRIKIYSIGCELLTEEITSLERSMNSGRIDHPSNFSKDISDAVCGSIWNASKRAEQFNYDYGEDIDLLVRISGQSDIVDKKAITMDFEQELMNLFTPKTQFLTRNNTQPTTPNNDIITTQTILNPHSGSNQQFLASGIVII